MIYFMKLSGLHISNNIFFYQIKVGLNILSFISKIDIDSGFAMNSENVQREILLCATGIFYGNPWSIILEYSWFFKWCIKLLSHQQQLFHLTKHPSIPTMDRKTFYHPLYPTETHLSTHANRHHFLKLYDNPSKAHVSFLWNHTHKSPDHF